MGHSSASGNWSTPNSATKQETSPASVNTACAFHIPHPTTNQHADYSVPVQVQKFWRTQAYVLVDCPAVGHQRDNKTRDAKYYHFHLRTVVYNLSVVHCRTTQYFHLIPVWSSKNTSMSMTFPLTLCLLGRHKSIKANCLHSKGLHPGCHLFANVAQANNYECLAIQLCAHVLDKEEKRWDNDTAWVFVHQQVTRTLWVSRTPTSHTSHGSSKLWHNITHHLVLRVWIFLGAKRSGSVSSNTWGL